MWVFLSCVFCCCFLPQESINEFHWIWLSYRVTWGWNSRSGLIRGTDSPSQLYGNPTKHSRLFPFSCAHTLYCSEFFLFSTHIILFKQLTRHECLYNTTHSISYTFSHILFLHVFKLVIHSRNNVLLVVLCCLPRKRKNAYKISFSCLCVCLSFVFVVHLNGRRLCMHISHVILKLFLNAAKSFS